MKQNHKWILYLLLSVVVITPVQAQRGLTLDECRRMAL